jgi:hypothetical protein
MMATATSTAATTAAPPESIWRSPLVPAALAVTAGVVLDRYFGVPLAVSLLAMAACLVAWLVTLAGPQRGLPLVYLAMAGVAFGAAYHHYRRDFYPPDDIGHYAPEEPHPVLVRGVLDEEPFSRPPGGPRRRGARRRGSVAGRSSVAVGPGARRRCTAQRFARRGDLGKRGRALRRSEKTRVSRGKPAKPLAQVKQRKGA